MSFAFIILFFALLIWIKAFIHDRISRFVLLSFVAYWCFALFSSTLSPLGLFPISDGTYGVLTLGVLSFVFGMSIVSTNSETKLNTYDLTQIKTIFNKTLSSRILICVYIIFTLIALKYSTKALIISALQDSASEMAAERETLIFEENYWVSQAYTYLMFPLFNFASMAIAYIIMYQLKGHRLMLSILLCYAATFSILAAGRSQFMVILLYFLIVFVCMERGKAILSVNSKQLKRIVMIGLLAVGLYIGMSYMTNFRTTGELQNSETAADSQMDSNMAETILSYSTLPLKLFDIALNEDYLTRLGGYRYGRATFAGMDVVACGALRRAGIDVESSSEIVYYLQDTWEPVSSTTSANYAYTGLFYHYMDFGIWGVFFFPFLFGMAFRYVIRLFNRTPSVPMLALIGICYFMMLHSVFTCYFIKPWIVLYIILLIIWHRKLQKNVPIYSGTDSAYRL